MHKWVDGGRYAALFDNARDTLTMDRLQVFDFESMRDSLLLASGELELTLGGKAVDILGKKPAPAP